MLQIIQLKDSKIVPLDIPRGYYVLVEMTTMAGYNIGVTVRDAVTKKEYFKAERQGLNPVPPISNFFLCDCEQMELFIDIPQSVQIDYRTDSMDITDKNGTLVIRTITALGEDATDADYNDFIINFAIMKSNV